MKWRDAGSKDNFSNSDDFSFHTQKKLEIASHLRFKQILILEQISIVIQIFIKKHFKMWL
jgi:hypothetical protein